MQKNFGQWFSKVNEKQLTTEPRSSQKNHQDILKQPKNTISKQMKTQENEKIFKSEKKTHYMRTKIKNYFQQLNRKQVSQVKL